MKKHNITAFIILPLILICFLYHNNFSYLLFNKYINRRFVKYLKINPLANLNIVTNHLDIFSFISSKLNPPLKDDFVDLTIKEDIILDMKNSLIRNKNKWNNIKIRIEDSLFDAKIKFHGKHGNHYINNKYSYTIKIKSDFISYMGMKKFKLIKSEEWDAINLAINNLANSEKLISSRGKMVILRINDNYCGEYALVEYHWSKDFLKRDFDINKFSVLRNLSGVGSKSAIVSGDWHRSEFDFEVEKIEDKSSKDKFFPIALKNYEFFTKLIKSNNIDSIKRYLDVDYMAKFFAFQSLFNDFHFTNGDNFQLLFDHEKKKFYPLYRQEHGINSLNNNNNWRLCTFPNFNKILFSSLPFMQGSKNHKFYMMLLSDNQFRNKRDKYLQEFLIRSDSIVAYLVNSFNNFDKIRSYANDRSRREYEIKKIQQLRNFKTLVNIAKDYLAYSNIYVSWNKNKNYISIISDSFSQIKLSNQTLECQDTLMNGIDFNLNLDWVTKKYILKIKKGLNFRPNDLIFYNQATGGKIDKNKIHINVIE
jgi:hypothetical protein